MAGILSASVQAGAVGYVGYKQMFKEAWDVL